MKSEFELAFNEISELRSLPRDVVLEALRGALVSAYQKEAGIGKSQHVEAHLDNTGKPAIYVEKEVVEEVLDHRTEITLEDARLYDAKAELGDMVMAQVETDRNFGRIAAQAAKQTILQKIRDAERNMLLEEFSTREGDLINGTVQAVNPTMITVGLGRAEAALPRSQQIPGERYKAHDKLRAYILEVKATPRGPQIMLSRSHRNMLRRLLELEVPEIYNGQVEIKNIAREAGYRSKVAVAALQEGIDPVGACVGMRGGRIQNIVKELHDEKIDVIEWNSNQETFIAKALSPARVSGVYLEDDPDSGRTAIVIVPEDQLSLAIGKEGQNARLAAKLTGWRIDIKSVPEAVQDAIDNIDAPQYKDVKVLAMDMIAECERILEKKANNRTVMPEEYQTLNRFADIAQRRVMAWREQQRRARVEQLNAVRRTLPQAAFVMPITQLEISDAMQEALLPLDNVGEVMLRFLIDEDRIKALLHNLPPDSIVRLQEAIDKIVFPSDEELAAMEAAAEAEAAVAEPSRDPAAGRPADRPAVRREFAAAVEAAPSFDDEDDDRGDKNKKGKKKGRQLVFDEKRGSVVAKKQHKQRGTQGWASDWDDEE
jgi:transcription termination/antitermination protein NusA